MTRSMAEIPVTTISDKNHKVGPSECLHCGRVLYGATGIDGDSSPMPGDIIVCIYCGHIQAFADDLSFRDLTDAEAHEIAGDRRILDVQTARSIAEKEME